jgi:biopolymer transport protein ExbB
MISGIIIVACIFAGWLIWTFIMGDGANFEGGVNTGHPLPGNYLAMVYKGGPIVPVLMGLLLMVVVFSFERYAVISKAAGKGNLDKFMSDVQKSIKSGDSEAAAETIHKEIEEATSLEMPMLEKHMTILSTLVSLGTLAGLLGTVTGMIKAFGALASSGTPDQAMLANGISEALINTATGISTSALAIVVYNLFTSKIDSLTYAIDEAGNTIVNTYRHFRGTQK